MYHIRFHKIAHALTARRFVVYGMDHIGHGKSSGRRALIPDYTALVKDYVSFAAYVRRIHPLLPISILAHGMGTLVTMLSLESIPEVAAVSTLINAPFVYSLPTLGGIHWQYAVPWGSVRQPLRMQMLVSYRDYRLWLQSHQLLSLV